MESIIEMMKFEDVMEFCKKSYGKFGEFYAPAEPKYDDGIPILIFKAYMDGKCHERNLYTFIRRDRIGNVLREKRKYNKPNTINFKLFNYTDCLKKIG